tara:strand:+ start:36 stop:3347 length:3312 start_codon:yes stop_codon:yes gene_type:complete
MAIIGDPFEEYVTNQINLRQKSLGDGFNGSDSLRKIKTQNVYNSSTPWMRLSSAVSITEGLKDLPGTSVYEQIEKSGLFDGIGKDSWEGTNLAKNFILQGAPNNQSGNASPSGVNLPGNKNVSYGWGYGASQINSQEGYTPPPGVTNVQFEYKSDGALAMATINIKAFSTTQFSMVDILYMRPGYTCLLEFGHSMYYKNTNPNLDPELVSLDTSNTSPFEYLFKDRSDYKETNPVSYTQMAVEIQKEKKKHEGNYEAFFGRISKFNWKFNMDGSYDITVKLMGIGDVISSLKVTVPKFSPSPISFNSSFTLSEDNQEELTEESTPEEKKTNFIISDALASQLNTELYAIFASDNKIVKPTTTEPPSTLEVAGEVALQALAYLNPFSSAAAFTKLAYDAYPSVSNDNSKSFPLQMQGIPVGGKDKTFLLPSSGAKFDVNDWGFTKYSPITLIKFGAFLSILQKICNVTNGENNQLLQFEMVNDISDGPEEQLKRDDTFIATYPGNFSSNPNKCLIKHSLYDSLLVEFDDKFTTNNLINNSLSITSREGEGNTMQKLENPSLAMRLSDVYINIGFIAEVISNLRGTDTESDDEVTITVIDLLRGVLSGVNTCLGGINNFRILYSEATCEIQIISETPILSQKATDDTPTRATINTFGFNTTDAKLAGGSFITSMDLNSELTDQMATQISIGAQNGGSTINSNSTTFSTYSKGLIDTLFEKKIDSLTEEERKKKEEEDLKNAINDPVESVGNKIGTILEESKFLTAFDQVYDDREFNPESYISTLENVVSNLSPLFQALYTMKKNSPAPFFLPFNLSLEMHGLAGMKIFNSFSIDGKGLPLSYNPKNIKLVIKSLSHTLSLEGWKTKVETISTPIFDVTSTPPPGFDTSPPGNISKLGNKLPPPPGQQPLESEKLRVRITRIMDDGTQTLGIMDIFAEDEKTILYSLATSELPWKGNENKISCIPTDNYRVISHVSGKYDRCFRLEGNSQGNYASNALYGNGYIRKHVLIHPAPKAPKWLQGCIGPGFKFNTQSNQKGRQKGTGDEYLNPSKEQSIDAFIKLLNTLYPEGSFKMDIINLNNATNPNSLPSSFNSIVKNAARSRNLL